MSDTPTPRTDALMEQWDYSPVVSVLIKHASQLERELAEAKGELEKVRSFLNDEKRAHFKNVETERELKSALRSQLTAHKAALNLCQMALNAKLYDTFIELKAEALSEIAKLKETTTNHTKQ